MLKLLAFFASLVLALALSGQVHSRIVKDILKSHLTSRVIINRSLKPT